MKKCRKKAGFTMVELMMVVAIVTILLGVAAVNVIKYQRALKGKEADSAAKEIFIAAQNHLTAADALGELIHVDDNGNRVINTDILACLTQKDELEKVKAEQFVVYPDTNYEAMRKKMLPFGAIDEQVRSGGSYIIRYNLKTATVLDVFYSDASDSRFGAELSEANFSALSDNYAGDAKKKERRNATVRDKTRRVIGWYGGAAAGQLSSYADYLKEPTIKVINADTLSVEISPLAAKTGALKEGASLSLIVTGVSSGAMKSFPLCWMGTLQIQDATTVHVKANADHSYVVTLDDITKDAEKFASIFTTETVNRQGDFIPGEDLDIRAVAYDNNNLSNIAESGTVRVNSLFGSLTKGGPDTTDQTKTIPDTVTISSFRHLENLDSTISRLDWGALATVGTEKAIASADRIGAKQDTDLDWTTFLSNTSDTYLYKPVIPRKTAEAGTNAPIPVIYHGQSHSIRNLSVSAANANAGLFDTLPSGSSVSNLDLVNFKVAAAGSYKEMVNGSEEQVNARSGALAGVANADLTNVKVYNDINGLTDDGGSPLTDDSSFSITGSGCVGGLAGEFTGSADGCAAAVYVKSTGGSAGGLFGTATAQVVVSGQDDGKIKNSYSGGHTVGGKYKVNPTAYTAESGDSEDGWLNVMGSTAGGLIGTLSSGTVENCYTTCSVGGTTAGGFVGKAEDTSTTNENCYCTGLVAVKSGTTYKLFTNPDDETKIGTFVGEKTGTGTLSGRYLELVNYRSMKEEKGSLVAAKSTDQMKPIGTGGTDSDSITPFDDTAAHYNDLTQKDSEKEYPGIPYDAEVLKKAAKKDSKPQYGFRSAEYTPEDGTRVILTHYGDWPLYETLVVNTKAAG